MNATVRNVLERASTAVLLLALSLGGAAPAQGDGILGFADIHNHQLANLAFGGRAIVGKAFGPIAGQSPTKIFPLNSRS